MKRAVLIILFLKLVQGILCAQTFNMSIQDPLSAQPMDMDAKVYYPVNDQNDNLCALIKVKVTNPLRHPLTLTVGGLAVVQRKETEDGEIWFYVPAEVRNLHFSCKGYTEISNVAAQLRPGVVYRLTIATDANHEVVTNVAVNSDYLKMQINPSGAIITIFSQDGRTVATGVANNGLYHVNLNFGTYNYRIEHSLYEKVEGQINFTQNSSVLKIDLPPAYNYLTVTSFPEAGANVFIDGELMGQTPLVLKEKFKKGECNISLIHNEYLQHDETVILSGDGTMRTLSITMVPQYGTVTCRCDDPEAEIWVDQAYKARGSWTGRLSSTVTHVIEAKKDNHQSQSRSFTVKNGETKTETVSAPVPLYAVLTVESDPALSKVYIDGNYAGEAPLTRQLLMGEHEIRVTKDGYVAEDTNVSLAHNEQKKISMSLRVSKVNVPVIVSLDKDSDLYIDGRLVSKAPRKTNAWSGTVLEGSHTFTARKQYHKDYNQTLTLEGTLRRTITLGTPTALKGTLNVKSNISGASVYLNGSQIGKTPFYGTVDAGYSTLSVQKSKYISTYGPRKVVIEPGEETRATFQLRKDMSRTWIGEEQYKPIHFPEVQYGLGIPVNSSGVGVSHYLGIEYDYVKTGLGGRASFMFGLGEKDFLGTVGPVFRVTPSYSDLDLQLYFGLGGGWGRQTGSESGSANKFSMAYDAGVRFAFNHPEDYDVCWYGISLGAKYFADKIIPTVGLELFPVGLFANDGLYEQQNSFAWNYIDTVVGYGVNREGVHVGLTYGRIRTKIGYYASALYEIPSIESESLTLLAGPMFRLTSDSSFLDLQLYAGLGTNIGYGGLAKDIGLRFAWRTSARYGLWNFNVGCMFINGDVVPTLGVGLGISLTALLGAAVGVLGAVAAI